MPLFDITATMLNRFLPDKVQVFYLLFVRTHKYNILITVPAPPKFSSLRTLTRWPPHYNIQGHYRKPLHLTSRKAQTFVAVTITWPNFGRTILSLTLFHYSVIVDLVPLYSLRSLLTIPFHPLVIVDLPLNKYCNLLNNYSYLICGRRSHRI